jgi:two-component system, OmpR family, response regulator
MIALALQVRLLREVYAMTITSTADNGKACVLNGDANADKRRCGVLIADDDSFIRTMLRLGLQAYGFRVYLASNGQDAVEVYRQHRDSVDIVLLDIRMPGLDGPQALEAIRILNPDIRCCFMSGETGKYSAKSLDQWKPHHFFAKPFPLESLARVLTDLVKEAPAVV